MADADTPDPAEAGLAQFRSLIAQLDAAAQTDLAASQRAGTDADGAGGGLAGLAAALRLTALLQRHGCGWADALAGEPSLAKRCGRLGSAFGAERQAAYVHALRYLARRRRVWSAVVQVPSALRREPGAAAVRPVPPTDARPRPGARADRTPAPPEGDWASTIAWLAAQRVWLDASQCAAVEYLASRIAEGAAPDRAEAAWLREMWWRVELRAAQPTEDPQ
jgi:hypothetical protein